LPGTVPFGRPALYNGYKSHPLGKSMLAMKAQLARFVIALIAMLLGLVAWMEMDTGWIPAALFIIVGFSISEVVYRRLADLETIRHDLEERVRNQHL
jgi:hypothetical protein